MGFMSIHLWEFIMLLTAANWAQYQVQEQHLEKLLQEQYREAGPAKHRNRNGTSARGKVRANILKRNTPALLLPVPCRPGLTIKYINIKNPTNQKTNNKKTKPKQNNFTWTPTWWPRKGRSFQTGTKSCTLYSWKGFICIAAILGKDCKI